MPARTYFQSRKPSRSIRPRSERLRDGGRRVRMRRHEPARQPRQMNAAARTAQGKPTDAIRRCSMMGKKTPPTELPDATMPIAYARLRLNQCPMTASAGLNLRSVSPVRRRTGGKSAQACYSHAEEQPVCEKQLIWLVVLGQRDHHQ